MQYVAAIFCIALFAGLCWLAGRRKERPAAPEERPMGNYQPPMDLVLPSPAPDRNSLEQIGWRDGETGRADRRDLWSGPDREAYGRAYDMGIAHRRAEGFVERAEAREER